jgi:hypothetical protein
MFSGVWESVREWTPTLPNELPLWELEFRWIPNGFPNFQRMIARFKTHWIEKFLNIIGNVLELKCLKWSHMTHLGIQITSYGQKKGRESNWQFDSRPLKVKNRYNFLTCRWCATYCWKTLDEGYNFALDFTSIKGLHKKLWDSKITIVLILRILIFPLGNPETKWYLGASPMAKHIEYYKGESGGGFPQVRAMVNLLNSWLLVVRLCNKSVTTMH